MSGPEQKGGGFGTFLIIVACIVVLVLAFRR